MFTKLIKNEIYTCGELYNCCSCGDNGCGCAMTAKHVKIARTTIQKIVLNIITITKD